MTSLACQGDICLRSQSVPVKSKSPRGDNIRYLKIGFYVQRRGRGCNKQLENPAAVT